MSCEAGEAAPGSGSSETDPGHGIEKTKLPDSSSLRSRQVKSSSWEYEQRRQELLQRAEQESADRAFAFALDQQQRAQQHQQQQQAGAPSPTFGNGSESDSEWVDVHGSAEGGVAAELVAGEQPHIVDGPSFASPSAPPAPSFVLNDSSSRYRSSFAGPAAPRSSSSFSSSFYPDSPSVRQPPAASGAAAAGGDDGDRHDAGASVSSFATDLAHTFHVVLTSLRSLLQYVQHHPDPRHWDLRHGASRLWAAHDDVVRRTVTVMILAVFALLVLVTLLRSASSSASIDASTSPPVSSRLPSRPSAHPSRYDDSDDSSGVVSWLLWSLFQVLLLPFRLLFVVLSVLWAVVSVLGKAGGLTLILVGLVLSCTMVGVVIGAPMIFVGAVLFLLF